MTENISDPVHMVLLYIISKKKSVNNWLNILLHVTRYGMFRGHKKELMCQIQGGCLNSPFIDIFVCFCFGFSYPNREF